MPDASRIIVLVALALPGRVWSTPGSGGGARVRVRGPGLASIRALRYGWASNPSCNLGNAEGLPASPFHQTR